jgi:hypothetical protein
MTGFAAASLPARYGTTTVTRGQTDRAPTKITSPNGREKPGLQFGLQFTAVRTSSLGYAYEVRPAA